MPGNGMAENRTERIIVGVTGASGPALALPVLRELRRAGYEIHLIVTDGAKLTWAYEMAEPIGTLTDLADRVYGEQDVAAPIASGSFVTAGMIVVPCSMKSLAGIASGYAENLLLRAADVCLKEGRRVVLVPREMPLGRIHLKNLLAASEAGCAIVPPMLTFYNHSETVEEQIRHVAGKVLLQFGIEAPWFREWEGKQ